MPCPRHLPHPEPFAPQTAPAALEDLRARLRATRWPDAPEDPDGRSGPTSATSASSSPTGQTGSTGRHRRRRSPGSPASASRSAASGSTTSTPAPPRPARPVLPLILSHGWPDSFCRYAKVIPLLTDPGAHGADPADAFDVVVPDMPGYGYSDRRTGLAPRRHRGHPPVGRAHERTGLRAVRRGARGHRQPREPLPRARLPGPGRGRPPHRRGPAPVHRRPGGPHARGACLAGGRRGLGQRPRAPTPPCTARNPRPPPSGSPTHPPGSPRGSSRSSGLGATATATSSGLHQGRDPHEGHALLAHRDHRLVDAHVPRERRDPARAARSPGRGAVRLLAVPRRRRVSAAGVARAYAERRARDRARPRRSLRPVRGARALREELRAFFCP